jgi:hypothetical protein
MTLHFLEIQIKINCINCKYLCCYSSPLIKETMENHRQHHNILDEGREHTTWVEGRYGCKAPTTVPKNKQA